MPQINVTFLQGRSFGIAFIPAGTTGDMDEDHARGLGSQYLKINGPATGTPILSAVSGGGNPVSVTGNSAIGGTLTATLATGWMATGYQWQRSTTVNATGVTTTADISGATSSTYVVTYSDGSTSTTTVRLSCRVSGLTYCPTGQQIPVATGAAPAWLMASTRNKYPILRCQTATGGGTGILSRYPHKIASGNPTKLRLVLNNAYLNSSGEFVDTSTVIVDQAALERVASTTGVAVTFGGSRSVTVPAGTVGLESDDILPSAFGLSTFTKGEDYFSKLAAHVATAGDYFPGSRQITEGGTQRAFRYNYGSGTVSAAETYGNFTAATGTPAITNEGTGGNSNGFSAMLIGYFDNGDTKVFAVLGDSIIDGTTSPYDGTFIQYACNTAAQGPYAMYEVSAGGADQADFNTASVLYRGLFKYARILIDELGTNGPTNGITTHFPAIWSAARAAGIKKIHKTRLLPRTYSSLTVTSITRVGNVATLTPATGTLPPVGASVTVILAAESAYNGTFTVTRSGSGSFDYTMASDPGASNSNPGTVRWSDRWTTEANQQYSGAGGPGGSNDLFDQQMVTYRNAGTIDGILPLAAAHGTDAFKWPTATPAYPNDTWNNAFATGTHPTTAVNNLIAAELAPQLDAMTV